VDRKLNEIKSPYTAEEFNKRLQTRKSRSTTSSATCAAPSPRQSAEQEITSRINITDQDVSNYYNEHKPSST